MSVFFSVVVVSYNAGDRIVDTLNSILSQDFEDYEVIVKDGCSTDNTLEYIPDSEKILVYSTKDNGIYNAMNEAISYCSGKYIVFINCGDKFYSDNVLSKIYDCASKLDSEDNIIYGDFYKKGYVLNQARKLTARKLFRITLCHQTVFYNRKIFEKYGNYDTSYKICADYEHMVRIFRKGISFIFCDCIIAEYEGGGFSENKSNSGLVKEENERIQRKYYSPVEFLCNRWFLSLYYGKASSLLRRLLNKKSFKKLKIKLSNFVVKKGLI